MGGQEEGGRKEGFGLTNGSQKPIMVWSMCVVFFGCKQLIGVLLSFVVIRSSIDFPAQKRLV